MATNPSIIQFFKVLLAECVPDMKNGWILDIDADTPERVMPHNLESIMFSGMDGKISGKAIVEHASTLGITLGQKHAYQIFLQKDYIPEGWRRYHIIFPGTVWRVTYVHFILRVMPHLAWHENEWVLGFTPVDTVFMPHVAALRVRSIYRTT